MGLRRPPPRSASRSHVYAGSFHASTTSRAACTTHASPSFLPSSETTPTKRATRVDHHVDARLHRCLAFVSIKISMKRHVISMKRHVISIRVGWRTTTRRTWMVPRASRASMAVCRDELGGGRAPCACRGEFVRLLGLQVCVYVGACRWACDGATTSITDHEDGRVKSMLLLQNHLVMDKEWRSFAAWTRIRRMEGCIASPKGEEDGDVHLHDASHPRCIDGWNVLCSNKRGIVHMSGIAFDARAVE